MSINEQFSRLEKQLQFILEVDKLKEIYRQSLLTNGNRRENDAEHSWHLALMAIILSEHANEEVDILQVIKMVIIHDLVEIDAGDTFAYDEKGNLDKHERELKAADRIFNILPIDQAKYIYELWDEFEKRETKEAKFAAMLDRFEPILLNYTSGGKSWVKHSVTKQMVINRNEHSKEGSEIVWQKIKKIIDDAVEKGYLRDDERSL